MLHNKISTVEKTGFIIGFCSVLTFFAFTQSPRYGVNDKKGEYIPDDVFLLNKDSVLMSLNELIDKPTVLNFVYFKCPGLCSPVMEGIAEVIDKSDLKLGEDYQVLTISIDGREKPSLARHKKQNYLNNMKKSEEAKEHWKFFTSDRATIAELTNATGWEFKRVENDFAHAALIIMLTPEGMVSQYLYGTYYLLMHFKLAVEDASLGKTIPARGKFLKYCYNYVKPENKNFQSLLILYGIFIGLFFAGILIYLRVSRKRTNSV
ncbi:SCO family protein [Bacteroidota bacterium]